MSVLHTESFIAFQPVVSSDDSNTTAVNNQRLAVAANIRRGGYDVYYATAAGSMGFAVRPDPVSPERNALFLSSDGSSNCAIRARLPLVNNEAIVGGFSLFIPNEYVKSSTSATASCMRVNFSGFSDTTWGSDTHDTVGNNQREVFRVSQDLAIRWRTDAPQSQKVLVPGRLHYIEYRVSPTDVRVWVDDVLVLQKQVSVNAECVSIHFDYQAAVSGSSVMRLGPGRWSVGNWYNLVEDAVAPNVRLGPTTRIIGVRPNTDVSTMFQRPSGYASNAAVVASDLVDAPAATLQSTSVGDQDVYASTTDTASASGKLIHAVNMKVLASNLESNPHTLRPLLRSSNGTESQTPKAREWRVFSPIHNRDLYAVARRPTDGKIFACGAFSSLIVNSDDGAPGTPWTVLNDDGAGPTFVDIAFRADGWGVIVQEANGVAKVRTIAPGTTVLGPAVNVAPNTIGKCVIVGPNGRFIVGSYSSETCYLTVLNAGVNPDVAANWVVKNAITIGALGQIAFAPNLGTGSGRVFMVGARTGGNPMSARTDDLGTSYATSYNGFNVAHAGGYFDPATGFFYTSSTTSGGSIRRTTDAQTWASIAPGWTGSGHTTAATYRMWNDPDTGVTITVGNLFSISTSHNSFDWRGITRLQNTAGWARGVCKRANGDYMVVGDGGFMAQYTNGAVEGLMAPLGGYLPYTYATGVNPATGAAWTPAEASQSQFGMRVTS